MADHEGKPDAGGMSFAIVASRFNDFIVDNLVQGATDQLIELGTSKDAIQLYQVPGAFEIPGVARKLIDVGSFDGIICLGAVIRGATPHFDYVAGETAKGISRVGLDTGIPVTFGVITADTVEQAIERAGIRAGNRGWDAALNAIEMGALMDSLA